MFTKFSCRNFRLTNCNPRIRVLFPIYNKSTAVMKKVASKQSVASVKAKPISSLPKVVDIDSTENAKFEVLPSPTKSFSDKKEYKVIRLENGLTACLISDIAQGVDVAALLSQESDESEDESEESDLEDEAVEFAHSDEEDTVKMRKHGDEVKLAAAALCIGVGSFSDPNEVPGLAHFLEHMVFMGSEKFPQENDFDAFIKKHGGSDNASTDYEVTTFYFECFEKHLHQAMDKFAQFFISPLMKRESMTREREAIESEFQMAVPSDDYRKEQLLASLAEKSSPVNSFSWGNLVTLRDNVSDDNLYEYLHEFRKRHYSAHRMTLSVQARLPMNMLEAYVVNCFSPIPNNGLPAEDFKQYTEAVLDTPQFKRLYYVKPVRDICQVDLTWVMPTLQHMYKSKPHVYVSWLLGHEGKGSLLSYLKKKVWALSLYAGNGESGAEFNSIYASFSVNIVLTKDGYAHLKEVVEAVFSYLQLLKDVVPDERIFREIQRIEEISFRFEEDETAADKVEDLVESMQNYPPEDYLTGSELFFEYNPEAIKMVLSHLVPDKMNITILSAQVPDGIVYDKTEQWFKTQYTDRDVPTEWLESWRQVQVLPDFTLPESNPFLTEDFSILPAASNIPEYPQKILRNSLIELWYRKDQKFGLPMACYYYYLLTPLATDSAKSTCMMQMFVVFLNMNLAEEGYPAQLAELSYSILSCEKGICLKVTGYNEKLPILIKLIAKYLKTVSSSLTTEVFEAVKEKQTKSFYNTFLKPSKLNKDMRLHLLQNKYFSLLEKHKAISEVTFEMMKEFSEKVLENLYIQGLIQGNVTSATALETTHSLLQELNCVALSPENYPKIVINEIPKGEHCLRVNSFNEDNSNSIITNYYQCGVLNIVENVILEFILLLIEEPLFDILRTKEQLGYSVYCTVRDTYGILGYSFTVNTQADKHTVEYVDTRIEAFLKHTQNILKKLSNKKFVQTKTDLIKMKKFVDVDLEDEVGRNWEEIVNEKYMFNRILEEIKAIEELKVLEIKKWWEDHNLFGKNYNYRKLSVQVVGHATIAKEIDKTKEDATAVKDNLQQGSKTISPVSHGKVVGHITTSKEIKETKKDTKTVTGKLQPDCKNPVTVSGNALRRAPIETKKSHTKKSPGKLAGCKCDVENTDVGAKDDSKTPIEFKLQLMQNVEEASKNNKPTDYFITNIDDFKSKLTSYPQKV